MRNVAVSHFSYDFRFNHYIQFTGLCAYPPVRFPELCIEMEKTYHKDMFFHLVPP